MSQFLLRKLTYISISILIVLTLTFALMKMIPGDPFMQEQALPQEIYEALLVHYGLKDPLISQYMRYLGQLVSLDFGPSLIYKGREVSQIIRDSFPTSALLGASALMLAVPLGLLLGILAAARPHRWQDTLIAFIAVLGISIPSFVVATLLQYILAIKFSLFPIARWGSWAQIILPALSLAALPTAFIARMTRTKMIEEMKQGYVTIARAKGLSEWSIMLFHVFRNILPPILSYLGPLTAGILTGSFIIEKIYSIPGLGYWFVTSVSMRDYPMIMGMTNFYCIFLLAISFVVDLLCLYLDPRLIHTATQPRGS
jgi:oligopeptide transport system permease protein